MHLLKPDMNPLFSVQRINSTQFHLDYRFIVSIRFTRGLGFGFLMALHRWETDVGSAFRRIFHALVRTNRWQHIADENGDSLSEFIQ